ncbi:MAG: glutamate ligase domain-containing protein, partial [Solirubrobacteraceae bacterium]
DGILPTDTAGVVRYDGVLVEEAAHGQRLRWRTRAGGGPPPVDVAVALPQPGAHNAANAAAALTAAVLAGADRDGAVAAMADFPGTGRRFETLGIGPHGVTIVDDYAHHPTEVAATLRAARGRHAGRLVAVFQPHLYSRTRLLAGAFGRALALADVVAVLDVYPARERAEDFPGTTGLTIAEATVDAVPGRRVLWLPTVQTAIERLPGVLRRGDLCVCMGAGDVDAVGRGLVTPTTD